MIAARPRATMRLQLHKDFIFKDAQALLPYLVDLGISHVYASPILTAHPGSIHGYDVIDPTTVNAELGGEPALRDFVAALRNAGLGLIVDIVPNHMAVGDAENAWWADVLRHGRASRYATFFDIDWERADPTLHGKVLAPFLGAPYGEVLDAGDLKLARDDRGDPVVAYFDNVFPIDPATYGDVTDAGFDAFDSATPEGRNRLHALLERQHYRLAWWGIAGDEINWRRFFDINGLAGLRVELPDVFEATHATLFRLYAAGLIDGFRVDHVDGLSDPPGYCRRLRERLTELAPQRPADAAQGLAYLVVEKILGAGETLPADWGVDGTSGYDFMNEVSALQHDPSAAEALARQWHELTGRPGDFDSEETVARREILERSFDAQLQSVVLALHRIAEADPHTRDVSAAAIRHGLVEILAHFPVYRSYGAGRRRSAQDDAAFDTALAAAREASPAALIPVLDQLDQWLGGVTPEDALTDLMKAAQVRFQQLSAPIAAKAVEDTAFYRYGRLLSRNDVGFDAALLGRPVEDFHQACQRRLAGFPHAMLATATHDHKRGEDGRARMAVISELPDEWAAVVARCRSIAAVRPDPADEIMLYQMVVGAWPLDLSPSDAAGCEAFAERLAGWQQKALREAKLKTSWMTPDDAYETQARQLLTEVMRPGGAFLEVLHGFVERIAPAGAVNGLVQAALKATVPGMPDFYQGTDFWDFSLVDPDNRRPVDYPTRRDAASAAANPDGLLSAWRDGRVKQALTRKVLRFREQAPDLFAEGDYLPLFVSGRQSRHFIAFCRRSGNSSVVVVAPRLPSALSPAAADLRFGPGLLDDALLRLPQDLQQQTFTNVLDDGSVAASAEFALAPILAKFPVAVLSRIAAS